MNTPLYYELMAANRLDEIRREITNDHLVRQLLIDRPRRPKTDMRVLLADSLIGLGMRIKASVPVTSAQSLQGRRSA